MEVAAGLAEQFPHVLERAQERYGRSLTMEQYRQMNDLVWAAAPPVQFLVRDKKLRIYAVPFDGTRFIAVVDPARLGGKGVITTLLPPHHEGQLRNR